MVYSLKRQDQEHIYRQFADVENYFEEKVEEFYGKNARIFSNSFFEENKEKLLSIYRSELNDLLVKRIIDAIPKSIETASPSLNVYLNRSNLGKKEREKIQDRLLSDLLKSYKAYLENNFPLELEREICEKVYDCFLLELREKCIQAIEKKIQLPPVHNRGEDYRFSDSFAISERELSAVIKDLDLAVSLKVEAKPQPEILDSLYDQVEHLLITNMHQLVKLISKQKML